MSQIGETGIRVAATERIGASTAIFQKIADHESQIVLALVAEPSYAPSPQIPRGSRRPRRAQQLHRQSAAVVSTPPIPQLSLSFPHTVIS